MTHRPHGTPFAYQPESPFGRITWKALKPAAQELKGDPNFGGFSVGDCWSCDIRFATWCLCQPKTLSAEVFRQLLLSPPDIGAPFMDGEFAGVSIHRSLTVWIWPYSSLHPDNYWAPSPKAVGLSGTGAMLCDLMLAEQSWTGRPKHLSPGNPLAKSKTLALPVLLVDEKVMCLRRGFDNFEKFKEHLGLTDPRE